MRRMAQADPGESQGFIRLVRTTLEAAMAMFFRRYFSDILMIAVCIGFGLYVVAESHRAHAVPSAWGAPTTSLLLAGR